MGRSSGKRLHVDNELSTPPTRALVEEFDGLQMSVQGQLSFAAHERRIVGSGTVAHCDECRRFRLIKLAERMQKQQWQREASLETSGETVEALCDNMNIGERGSGTEALLSLSQIRS